MEEDEGERDRVLLFQGAFLKSQGQVPGRIWVVSVGWARVIDRFDFSACT
jgi:hypothetical protein